MQYFKILQFQSIAIVLQHNTIETAHAYLVKRIEIPHMKYVTDGKINDNKNSNIIQHLDQYNSITSRYK